MEIDKKALKNTSQKKHPGKTVIVGTENVTIRTGSYVEFRILLKTADHIMRANKHG